MENSTITQVNNAYTHKRLQPQVKFIIKTPSIFNLIQLDNRSFIFSRTRDSRHTHDDKKSHRVSYTVF